MKIKLFLVFIHNWVVMSLALAFCMTIVHYFVIPVSSFVMYGKWETSPYVEYYRYLIACIPAGGFAGAGFALQYWIQSKKEEGDNRKR